MDYVPPHTLISKQAFTIYKSFTLDVSKIMAGENSSYQVLL